ncbi:MAG: YHS domain-containing protein [Cyclobacteriaceae bacterium]|nr:MAG: YHS domain-containing protein [Cyclobacteriaceae bacterium]
MKNLVDENFWALIVCFCVAACSSNQNTAQVFATEAGAIGGYDPVAYFTQSQPVKGIKEFSFEYADQSWYFASAENLELFKSNPEKYAPQFGGYCAYGMSRGYKAKTEPDAWTIVEGKLYLNYNTDVRTIWNENQRGFIEKANANWPTVKGSKFEN